MSPLSYAQVREEYENFRAGNPDASEDLATFAQRQDFREGKPLRSAAYQDSLAKRVNATVDSVFAPAAEFVAPLGAAVDRSLRDVGGYQGNVAEESFRALPRSTAEFAGYMAAGPAALPLKIAGSASAALNTYANTDSVPAALISAAGLPATDLAMRAGGTIASKYVANKLAAETAAKLAAQPLTVEGVQTAGRAITEATVSPRDVFAHFLGSQGAALGVSEVQRQATDVALGQGLSNPFTMDNLVGQAAGALPFLPADIAGFIKNPGTLEKRAALGKVQDDYVQRLQEADARFAAAQKVDTELQVVSKGVIEPATVETGASTNSLINASRAGAKDSEKVARDYISDPLSDEESLVTPIEPVDHSVADIAYNLRNKFTEDVDSVQAVLADPVRRKAAVERAIVASTRAEEIKFMSADRLSDPASLAAFIGDVNTELNRLLTPIAEPVVVKSKAKAFVDAKLGKGKFDKEIAAADIEDRRAPVDPGLISPMVLDQLRKEGLLEPAGLTVERLRKKYGDHLDRAIIGGPSAAYTAFVQEMVNTVDILAREANRQKALKLQKKLIAAPRRDVIVAEIPSLVAKLPPDLRARAVELAQNYTRATANDKELSRAVLDPENALLEEAFQRLVNTRRVELKTKSQAEQDRLPNFYKQLKEIVSSYDQATGLVKITEDKRFPVTAEDGTLVRDEKGDVVYKEQTLTSVVPIAEALERKPKSTKAAGFTKNKDTAQRVSLDVLTEEGAMQEGAKLQEVHDSTGDLGTEVDAPTSASSRMREENIDETDASLLEDSPETIATPEDLTAAQVRGSASDTISSRGEIQQAVASVTQHLLGPDVSKNEILRFIDMLPTDAKGRPTMAADQFVKEFPLALETFLYEGTKENGRILEGANPERAAEARKKLAKLRAFYRLDDPAGDAWLLTDKGIKAQENALVGIFGPNTKGNSERQTRLRKMFNIMMETEGIDPDSVQLMKGVFDPETQTIRMEGDPQALQEGLKEALTTHFKLLGMGELQTAHFVNLSLRGVSALKGLEDLKYASVSVKNKAELPGLANKISERLAIYGMYGSKYTDIAGKVHNSPWIGLVLNHQAGNPSMQPFWNFLTASLGAHETIHAVLDKLPTLETSADSGLRMQAVLTRNTLGLLNSLSAEDRLGTLTNLLDTVVPKQFARLPNGNIRPEVQSLLSYAASKPEETMATYAQMYIVGLMGEGQKLRKEDVVTALRFEAPQIQDFVRGVFRDVSDYTQGLLKTSEHPAYRKLAGLPALTGSANARAKAIETLHAAMKELIKPDLVAEKAKFAITQAAKVLDVNSIEFLGAPPKYGMDVPADVRDLMTPAQVLFYGVDPRTKGGNVNAWTKWLGNYHQVAQATGSQEALKVFEALSGVESQRLLAMHRILGPVMKLNERGLPIIDESKPLRQLRKASEKPRQAANDILRTLQELSETDGFNTKVTFAPDGTLADGFSQARKLNPEFDKTVGTILSTLKPDDRALVLGALDNYLAITRNAANERVNSAQVLIINRLARLMQLSGQVPGSHEALIERGAAMVEALNRQDNAAFSQTIRDLPPALAASMLETTGSLVEMHKQLRSHMDSKPYYASEERRGQWMVEHKNKDGVMQYDGALDESHADKLIAKFKAQGGQPDSFSKYKKSERYGDSLGELPEFQASRFAEIETQAYSKLIEKARVQFGDDVANAMKESFNPGAAVVESITASSYKNAMKQRRLAGGRQRIDYLDTLDSTTFGTAAGVANKAAFGHIDLLMNSEALRKLPDFKARTRDQIIHTFQPGDENLIRNRTMVAGYYMGANFGGMVAETANNFQVGQWDLVKDGATVKDSTFFLVRGLKTVAGWYNNPKAHLAKVKAFEAGDKTKENAAAWAFQKYLIERPQNNAYDEFSASDRDIANTQRALRGESQDLPLSRMLTNPLYQLATKGLKFYGNVANFNAKAMFNAAFEHATTNKKMSPEAAYDYAATMTTMSTYSGGRANQSGIVAESSKTTALKSMVSMGMVLQQYAASAATSILHDGMQAIGRDPRITPLQRVQARKAFAGRMAMQMSLAGALGLPFAAVTLKALSVALGRNLEQDIREGLASLAGDDEELGAWLADSGMRGLPRQALGIDIGKKFALSGVMGIGSDYGGFRLSDMLGPLPGFLENMGKATYESINGNQLGALQQLVPPSLKNAVNTLDTQLKYGRVQFMDKSNNLLMVPGKMEAISYALGLTPSKLARLQEASMQMKVSGDFATTQRHREADRAARALLDGNDVEMHNYIAELRQNDPTLDPSSLVKDIIDRSIDMMTPKDFMATRTPLGQKAQNRIIASTFPGPFNRQSETQRLQMRDNAIGKLGYPYGMQPSTSEAYMKASMIDQLTAQGKAKPEAAREVELMTSRAALARTLM